MEILICFCLLCVLQAVFINGVKACFEPNMIFAPLAERLKKILPQWSQKQLFACVRCMSLVYGAITFWPTVIYVFGFHTAQLFIFVADVFILVHLNYFIYKRS